MLIEDKLTEAIIGAALEVHRVLGPGLLESAYEECLCHELKLRGICFARQVALPVVYKDVRLDCGYRMDLVVEGKVIIELKTYLKLSGRKIGLLFNFHSDVLRNGMKRMVL